MKLIFKIAAVVLIVALLVAYVPYYFHGCDGCDKFFVGPGYDANLFVDIFTGGEQVICGECAKTHHALSQLFGGDLSKYSRPLIVDPITAYKLLVQ